MQVAKLVLINGPGENIQLAAVLRNFIKSPRLGHEVGGIIDILGKNVRRLQLGDRITCRYIWGA